MSNGNFCRRCRRQFVNRHAIKQHLVTSSHHHLCDNCNYDAYDFNELLDHWRDEGCYEVCEQCESGVPPGTMAHHLQKHYACLICQEHCENQADLNQHANTHVYTNITCWGCPRIFKSLPAMILHLEGGNCDSDITVVDLNEAAAASPQWHYFISSRWRNILHGRRSLRRYRETPLPFKCPCCDMRFRYLSALIQHVANPTKANCEENLLSFPIKMLVLWLSLYQRHWSA
ncbi:hypothetical protein BU16DRAFT_614466 [Lophium mytilinum]|uniref:C2H2-type domain-containing protein n=1 Tax=Lophium mytilinum TaxID=390894 RepID=A0A6A6R7H5_9PEZI|nr:hypothetical protein BU16DRAFT_614466 [Lophium mytilinum]